jgi:uncharacterized membrane protein YagU involved in acid resistance
MNKKFWIAFVVVFLVMNALNFVVHDLLLGPTYRAEPVVSLFRPEAQQMLWVHFVTAFVFSFFFTLIFSKGYEGKGIMEGLRYGVYVGFLVAVPMAYDMFAVLPIPYHLALGWFLYGLAQYTILGVVVAAMYGKKQ